MEEDTSEEADPLQVLSQFADVPLHVEESFDLVLPSDLEPSSQADNQTSAKNQNISDGSLNFIEEVLLDSDDEEETPTKTSENQSILLQLLKPTATSTTTALYNSPPASSGLSALAQKVPNVTVFNNSKPSSPGKSASVPDRAIKMRLLCVADVEFDLSAHFQAKHNIPKYSTFYTVIVFNLGCLFLPRSCLGKRKPFLQKKGNLFISTRWCKENPERKSHDTILFPDLNLLVQKPGKANEVFTLMEKDNTFFLGPNAFVRVCQMYQHQYYLEEQMPNRNNLIFISAIQFSRITPGLNKETQNRDVKVLMLAQTACRLQEKQKLLQDLYPSNLGIPRRNYTNILCSKCGRKFKQMSELLYHQFLCFNPSESFDLVRFIKESVPNMGQTHCTLCQRRFTSDHYCSLHFDSHVHKGHVYPCYLCGKIFLTSLSFIRHQCLSNRKLPRKYLHNPAFKTTVTEIYSQLSPEVRQTVLRCPVCGKQCEFLSQLLSHIHIGSNCLLQLLDTGKVTVSDADLSLDLGPVLGVTQADSERLIQCSSCRLLVLVFSPGIFIKFIFQ